MECFANKIVRRRPSLDFIHSLARPRSIFASSACRPPVPRTPRPSYVRLDGDFFGCNGTLSNGSDPDLVDKSTHEIRQDDDKTVYSTLEEIGDDLPDHSPRFVLLSYPLTLVSS